MNSNRGRIGISMGDPAGIGPELCLRVLSDETVGSRCMPVVFGDVNVLYKVAKQAGIPAPEVRVMDYESWQQGPPDEAAIVDMDAVDADSVEAGRIDARFGKAAYMYIKAAMDAATAGGISGISTAPINKESFHSAGVKFAGHTDMLASLLHSPSACMMMASEKLCVSLVTTHISHKAVAEELSTRRIYEVIGLSHKAMVALGRKEPRVTVCALNPHAGEHGLFGIEEERIILPAVEDQKKRGINVSGPVSPDTAFTSRLMEQTDVYVAMYHDQGLIPFKMVSFDEGVNVTLGLPIVRTSPGHGTAFDIAWQGKASSAGMVQSILWAARLAGI